MPPIKCNRQADGTPEICAPLVKKCWAICEIISIWCYQKEQDLESMYGKRVFESDVSLEANEVNRVIIV